MKRNPKKLQLSRETVRLLDLSAVTGGWEGISRGFTNCTYCNGRTKWGTDCTSGTCEI